MPRQPKIQRMARLIQKSGILRSGGNRYLAYIATREGVEKLVPESGYLAYIAQRPRVEKQGNHGLFSAADQVDLKAAMEELSNHPGTVWTVIYSLRRGDAARLGYDRAASWRRLLMAHQGELAEAMRIPAHQLRWYAAYHDEGAHPHVHMVLWSEDPKQGYLSRTGIAKMRSVLTNDIFSEELHELYVQKDLSYRAVTEAARAEMVGLIRAMESSASLYPAIEEKLWELARGLESVSGKKQYGYLRKPLKALVDEIVAELEKVSEVARCYAVWNDLRDQLEGYYKTTPRQHAPLSQQKEFRAIKNQIIREAEQLRSSAAADGQSAAERTQEQDDHGTPERQPAYHLPEFLPPTARLLYHMGRIFRESALPPSNPLGIRVDSKRRRKLMERRMAAGHKLDDHEERQDIQTIG